MISGTGAFTAVGTGVTVNATTITLGNSTANTGGVAWYAGNSNAAYCVNGICNFSYGIRAYFTFADSYTSTPHGDGFTFTIINGANNNITKRGGQPATACGTAGGELMAYAGPGPVDGLGLQPPKWPLNLTNFKTPNLGTNPSNGGRNDGANNHMALMLWGLNTPVTYCTGVPRVSYDDNIHGAGTSTTNSSNPTNSASGDLTNGYYDLGSTTYLNTTASHTARIEIIRNQTANADTNYNYNVQAWIDCTSCSDVTHQSAAAPPQINRTIRAQPYVSRQF